MLTSEAQSVQLYPMFDAEAVCVKCGGTTVTAEWKSGASYSDTRWIGHMYLQFMLRRCRRCFFGWREECLDTPQSVLDKIAEIVEIVAARAS